MAAGLDLLAQAAVSAVTAGGVAYLTVLWRTNGEIRKLRAERDEMHYSHRQANYHNLLNAERRLQAALAEGDGMNSVDTKRLNLLRDDFQDSVNGVIISGSDDAVKWAHNLDHVYFAPPTISESGHARELEAIDWNRRRDVRRWFIDEVRRDLGAPGSRRV